jgi:FkbM family methyltransferase
MVPQDQPGAAIARSYHGVVTSRFVSYAQNFEDVMLWRALGDVTPGFYIDIGANSPTIDSVTRAFYERGWRGINVEPNPELHRQLVADRPEDVNLDIAVAEEAGRREMAFAKNTGLSTLDAARGTELADRGMPVERRPVDVDTLAALWARHVPPGREVHFLKIDVEGFEGEVLAGANLATQRPWILIVEATRPETTEPSYDEWETALIGHRYELGYADGINRFYVAAEHRELLPYLRYPPNFFDRFVRASEQRALDQAARAEAALAALRSSRSWRLTRPLRRLGAITDRLRGRR